MSVLLGRTNHVVPREWYRLSRRDLMKFQGGANDLESRISPGTVIDCSRDIALHSPLSQLSDLRYCVSKNCGLSRATHEGQAADFVEAALIEALSALNVQKIQFFFLSVQESLEEFQITGALRAFEIAIQDGVIDYLGLHSPSSGLAALGVWQFHDAFQTILVEDLESLKTLKDLARERRVGVVGRGDDLAAHIHDLDVFVREVELS